MREEAGKIHLTGSVIYGSRKKIVYNPKKRVLKQKSVIKCLAEHYSSHVAFFPSSFYTFSYNDEGWGAAAMIKEEEERIN